MSTGRLVFWITLLGVFAMASRISVDTDTWWHLRAGQWIIENGRVPQFDPFSYTRLGQPWQYPGWLVEVPMAVIYKAVGPGGLNLWTAGMVTLAFAFLWHTLSGGAFLRAFVVILATAVSGVYWAARPHLVTFLLAAVFLFLLEGFREKRLSSRHLRWMPVLMVFWVNSHGGFIIGFILWGVYWVAEILRLLVRGKLNQGARSFLHHPSTVLRATGLTLSWVGLLLVAAVCLNPSGPVMLFYPFKTVSIGALQDYIQEWQTPDFHLISNQPFIWLLLLTFLASGISRRRLALEDVFLVSGFAYLGMLAGRNLALFALAAPPVLTRHAAPLVDAFARRLGFNRSLDRSPGRLMAWTNWLLLVILAAAVAVKVGQVIPWQVNEAVFEKQLPVRAVTYIRDNHMQGRLFNSYNWGGYLLWNLPDYPVFIDGRTDLYDDELINQWLQVVRAEGEWQKILENWDVHVILIEPSLPLTNHLESNGWKRAYEDDHSVVFSR